MDGEGSESQATPVVTLVVLKGIRDLTGRGSPYLRGAITGAGTFLGGAGLARDYQGQGFDAMDDGVSKCRRCGNRDGCCGDAG
jgi:hypothetical protein